LHSGVGLISKFDRPSCGDVDRIVEMIDAGMDIARMNFAHGDHKLHGQMLEKFREAQKKRPTKNVALLLHTKGPEIKTGMLMDHKPIILNDGQELEITTDNTIEGDTKKISCTYKSLAETLKVGDVVLMSDATITAVVTEMLDVRSVYLISVRMELKQ
jgi:pyruvate kinase